jgi:hypothetical protein
MKGFSNLVAVENFDARNSRTDYIKDDHSIAGVEFYVAVVGTLGALRAGLSIKRRTKVIPTAAAVNDSQRTHLC